MTDVNINNDKKRKIYNFEAFCEKPETMLLLSNEKRDGIIIPSQLDAKTPLVMLRSEAT